MKTDTYNCQIVIKEKTNKHEILKGLATLLTRLEQEQGIDEYSNINLSFEIYKNKEKQVLVSKAEPTKKYTGFIAQPKPDHKIGCTEIDYEDLKQSVEDTKINRRDNIPQISLSMKEYTDILKESMRVPSQSTAKPQEAPKTRTQLLQELLSKKLNVSIPELKNHISAVEYLTDEFAILDFIDPSQMPKDKKAILIRFKDQETGRMSHYEIYSMDLQLIK